MVIKIKFRVFFHPSSLTFCYKPNKKFWKFVINSG
jgi:hypothetical protein